MAQRGFMKKWSLGLVDGVPVGDGATALLSGQRLDSYDTMALQQTLEQIKTTIYMRKKPPRQFLQYIPLDTSGGVGLQATGFVEGDERAKWTPLGDKSADFDQADGKLRKHTYPVMTYASGYGWWRRELEVAQRLQQAGMPLNLDQRCAMAVREAYDELVEEHTLYGEVDLGVYGILNHPDIRRETLATAFSSATSASDLLNGLIDIVDDVEDQSEGIEIPGTLMVPARMYRRARRTYFTQEPVTVAQRFQDVTGFALTPVERFKSITLDKLQSGGSTTTTTSVAIAGRFDPSIIEKAVPRPFEQLPAHVQSAGLETVVPCLTDLGGLHVYYLNAFKIYQGIWSGT